MGPHTKVLDKASVPVGALHWDDCLPSVENSLSSQWQGSQVALIHMCM